MNSDVTGTVLTAAALQQIPNAAGVTIGGGQIVPLDVAGPRSTATTSRLRGPRGLAYDAGRAESFKVGMDINLIIRELHQNTLRHLCIEDVDRSRLFADPEVRILAAALADNTSVITLRIPGCHATDVSLIPLYKSLLRHPSIRSLDISDTKGSESAAKALVKLVCRNTQIVHVERTNVRIDKADANLLDEALAMNCFNCQDPGRNPYDASLIKYIDEAGRLERTIKEQITLKNPYMVDPDTGEVPLHVMENLARFYAPSVNNEGGDGDCQAPEEISNVKKNRRKKKGVQFGISDDFEVHRRVCEDYMNGQCRYGSRCKYLHPERTSASMNRIIAVRAEEEEERLAEEELRTQMDDRTTVMSRATSRLRGRTTSSFKFDPAKVPKVARAEGATPHLSKRPDEARNCNTLLACGSLVMVASIAACIVVRTWRKEVFVQ